MTWVEFFCFPNLWNIAGIKKATEQIGLEVNSDGISKGIEKITNTFSGLNGEKGNPNDYLNAIPGLTGVGKAKDDTTGDKKTKKSGDGITDGGNKITTINISINKLQDQTNIYVDKTETGINNLGEKVQEILLRATNSALQMQTG